MKNFHTSLGYGQYSGLFQLCTSKSLKYLAFQHEIRKLLQGSISHALNITGHISLNPRLQHKQNCLNIYLTYTLFIFCKS